MTVNLDSVPWRETQQHLPIVGETELSGRAVKQAHPEMFFQLGDLTGDRSLTEVPLTGDGRKRAGLRHPHQHSKRAE